jgi:GntR family transcriptional regulator
MVIAIDKNSRAPNYVQIKNQIKQDIINKKLVKNDKLPSIRVLAKQLNVAVITVKRSYDDLVGENILISVAGKGVYVSEVNIELMIKDNEKNLEKELNNLISESLSNGLDQQRINKILIKASKEIKHD